MLGVEKKSPRPSARAGPSARRLFPSRRPRQPISAYQLGTRLEKLGFRAWQVSNAALFDLAMDLPAALLARLLGINVEVAAAWQRATAGD